MERRFKNLLRHSPQDYIVRVKIYRVKTLLTGTDLSMAQMAERTGFDHVE